MDFGRLDDASLVPWELPPRDPSNRARVRGPGRMWWGAPSWGSPSLAREAYPPRTPRARWLAAYAQRFPAVELAFADERLSTKEAEEILRESGLRGEKARSLRDSTSAVVLLRDHLRASERTGEDGPAC